jgi:hypothetical protein
MKYRSFVHAGIAALTMASSHAFAQDEAYQHGVTLTLTQYSEGDEKVTTSVNSVREVNTYKSVFVTRKFSNKQLLEALVEQGVISSISGWSLKLLETTDGATIGLFIVKNNVDPIDVSDFIGFETEEVVEEYTETETDFTNGNYTDRGTWNERGLASVFVDVPGLDVMLNGSYYSRHSYSYEENFVEESETYDEKLLSANIYNLVGVAEDGEEEESLVEGSAAVGPGRLVDFIVENPS